MQLIKPELTLTLTHPITHVHHTNRADKRVSRYKTLDEQRAERRSYFSEKEIAIDAPTAPPRYIGRHLPAK